MKHTPGKWIRDGKTVYSLHQTGWNKGEPLMSNRFSLNVYPDYRLENAEQEAEANARLIASAPLLLEALQEITQAISYVIDTSHIKLSFDKAQQAISKAIEDQD